MRHRTEWRTALCIAAGASGAGASLTYCTWGYPWLQIGMAFVIVGFVIWTERR